MSDPGGSRSPIGYQIGIRVATILDRFASSMLLNYMDFFTFLCRGFREHNDINTGRVRVLSR